MHSGDYAPTSVASKRLTAYILWEKVEEKQIDHKMAFEVQCHGSRSKRFYLEMAMHNQREYITMVVATLRYSKDPGQTFAVYTVC